MTNNSTIMYNGIIYPSIHPSIHLCMVKAEGDKTDVSGTKKCDENMTG